MKIRNAVRLLAVPAAVGLITLALAGWASAHVTVTPERDLSCRGRAAHLRDLAGPGEPARRRVREPCRLARLSRAPGWAVTVTGTVCRKPSTRTCTKIR